MHEADLPEDALSGDARSRIITAAAELIATRGSEAATTRAVAAAALVQAPTIYRLFGDKDGLLDAVTEHILSDYVTTKAQLAPSDDPVADLRQSWDAHVTFGLAHPAIFALMHTAKRGPPSSAWAIGIAVFRERVRRIARTGRLRVSEEHAVDLLDSMGTGTILTLLRKAPGERAGLSETARDAVFAAVFSEQAEAADLGAGSAASALRAWLDDVGILSPGERQLLGELLQRIAHAG